jgi:glyoxylase-like metal-dependent hydrolase (beta-lactamase superfamily II)
MPLPFALNHVNLWLIEERDGYTLVDCGYGDATTRAHWQQHFSTTFLTRPIRRIVATHCHPDHLGNAAWLAAHFDCGVAMTQGEFLAAHA